MEWRMCLLFTCVIIIHRSRDTEADERSKPEVDAEKKRRREKYGRGKFIIIYLLAAPSCLAGVQCHSRLG